MKFSRKSYPILLGGALFILLCAWHTAGLCAYPHDARESDYSVYTKGIRVGELKTFCEFAPYNDKPALKFESSTHVNVNLIFYSFRLDNHEEALIGDQGTIHYQRTTREKEKLSEVEGRLDHGRFLLDIRENGARRTMAVERDRYDYTTMECPEVTMKREGEEMTVRLLDLETLMIVNRRYHWVKSEEMTVDGQKILCRVVDFEDVNKKCRRWIRPDAGGAVIVRQDGSGKNGHYSLRMAHLKNGA